MKIIKYILICVLMMIWEQLRADHIIGGDVTYEVVSVDLMTMKFLIDVKVTLYRDVYQGGDPNAVSINNEIDLGIFSRNGDDTWSFIENFIVATDTRNVPLVIPNSQCYNIERPETVAADRTTYVIEDIRLDIIDSDYLFSFQRCCKTESIINIVDPGAVGISFEFSLTPEQQRTVNSSPVFDEDPANFMCAVYPQELNFSAEDAEGDSLVYQFCEIITAGGEELTDQLANCNSAIPNPEFCGPDEFGRAEFIEPTYSFDFPIPGATAFTIDPQTGIISGEGAMPGIYTFAICLSEFRRDTTTGTVTNIGNLKRDYLINVVNCPPVQAAPAGVTSKNPGITLDEARTECAADMFIDRPFDSCGEVEVLLRNFTDADEADVGYRWEIDLNEGTPMIITDRWEPNVTFPGLGSYAIKLTINPGEACETFCTQNIIISESFSADFEVTDDAVCDDAPVAITNTSVVTSAFDFSWDFGNGTTSNVRDPMPVNYTTAGEYEINLEVSRDVCMDTAINTVKYFPLPDNVVVVPDGTGGCDSARITFENQTLMDPHPFELTWNFGDGAESSETSPTHLYSTPGTYMVDLVVKASEECQQPYPVQGEIVILDGPEAIFTADPNPVTNPRDQVSFVNLSVVDRNTSFIWDFDDGSMTTMEPNATHVYDQVGIFNVSLIATSALNTCSDTSVVSIVVSASGDPIFPNAFKPFDGNNNIFKPYSEFNSFVSYEMSIWDRWGQRVYETDELEDGWDGSLDNSGSTLPAGVYIWKVSYVVNVGLDVEQREQAGTVLMIK